METISVTNSGTGTSATIDHENLDSMVKQGCTRSPASSAILEKIVESYISKQAELNVNKEALVSKRNALFSVEQGASQDLSSRIEALDQKLLIEKNQSERICKMRQVQAFNPNYQLFDLEPLTSIKNHQGLPRFVPFALGDSRSEAIMELAVKGEFHRRKPQSFLEEPAHWIAHKLASSLKATLPATPIILISTATNLDSKITCGILIANTLAITAGFFAYVKCARQFEIKEATLSTNFPQSTPSLYKKYLEPMKLLLLNEVDDGEDRKTLIASVKLGNTVFPDRVRDEINRAKDSELFKEIFIITEVDTWQTAVTTSKLKVDPLVIGYDGYQHWLLDKFDLTPLEEWASLECAYKPDNDSK